MQNSNCKRLVPETSDLPGLPPINTPQIDTTRTRAAINNAPIKVLLLFLQKRDIRSHVVPTVTAVASNDDELVH